MHRRLWLNDPDCLMVRAGETDLTPDEVRTLATAIALTDGMFVLSDRLEALPPERLEWIERLLPLLGGDARVDDLFERGLPEQLRAVYPDGEAVALFNFSGRSATARCRPYRPGPSPAICGPTRRWRWRTARWRRPMSLHTAVDCCGWKQPAGRLKARTPAVYGFTQRGGTVHPPEKTRRRAGRRVRPAPAAERLLAGGLRDDGRHHRAASVS